MSVTVDEDLTFTQAEARVVCQEYVCAICASSLHVQSITGHARVFILCPEHGNTCLAGRVMKSTVDIRVRNSVENRVVYAALAAHPAVYGSVLTRGIPRADADIIARKSVCSLCGFELHVYSTTSEGRTDADTVVLKCGFCKTNIGLTGWGFVSRESYTHVPPVKVREYLRKRSQIGLLPVQDMDFQTPVFDKLGSLTITGDTDNPVLAVHARTRAVNERVRALLGKECRASEVGIQLLFPTLESTFSQSLECYNRGAMFARAKKGDDGYHWDYYRDPLTQEIEIRGGAARTVTGWRMMSNPVTPETVLYTNARGEAHGLQNTGRLRFILQDLKNQTGMPIPGYFEMIIVGDALPGIEASIQNARDLAFDNGMTASELPMSISIQDGRPKLQLDLLRKN